MNPVPPQPPPPDPEARLTALLLGELSPEETAAVYAELAARPDQIQLLARLARTLPLVREAVSGAEAKPSPDHATAAPALAPLRLSPERRQALLAAFKTVSPPAFAPTRRASSSRHTYWLALAAVVTVLLALGVGMMLPALSKAKAKAQYVSQRHKETMAELKRRLAEADAAAPPQPPAAAAVPSAETSDRRGQTHGRPKVLATQPTPTVALTPIAPTPVPSPDPAAPTGEAQSKIDDIRMLMRYSMLGPNRPARRSAVGSSEAANFPESVAPGPAPAPAPAVGESFALGLPIQGGVASAAPGRWGAETRSERDTVALKLREERLTESQAADATRLDRKDTKQIAAVAAPAPALPIHQPEVATAENPFSTFSLNVADVSFRLAAASLEAGQLPPPGVVRVEEFVNAFDYRDPAPAPGAPLAFHWNRARHPFAHNRELVRFSVRTAALGREPGRALNLVLVLDRSGSMERADRVATCREMLRVLAGQLQPADRLSVVTFARTARLFAEGVAGDHAGPVLAEAAALTPEGGTHLEDALRLGYQVAVRHFLPDGVNRVVLITDGAANLGDVMPDSLKQLVEDHRRCGVALDAFGVGWEDYNDELLEVLTRHGDGRYGFLNSPDEAAAGFAAQLAGALRVAAADVKVQVEFNPARVTRWRQIGYARHQLTAEQFRDNTVDAAELGAAEAGTALYALEVNAAGQGPLGICRVRYREPASGRYRELAWTLDYRGPARELADAGPALRLAATAALFAEWLAQSPFAGDVSPERLQTLLAGVPEAFAPDPRPALLAQMLEQARRLAGR